MTVIGPKRTIHAPDHKLVNAGFVLPENFEIAAVDSVRGMRAKARAEEQPVPPLGPLQDFTGVFTGNGFNAIFRPQGPENRQFGGDNVLELNLTSETLSFIKSLGSVPNRGMVQADICLNGVPYLQTIKDINDPEQPVDIHFEPGLWMAVPSTTDPALGPTLVRMASVPHGTTFMAQGTWTTASGPPTIPAVDMRPMFNQAGKRRKFPSQIAKDQRTARIPQDLSSFIKAGTITQRLLDNPNSLLRAHIACQDIAETTTISVATNPQCPLFSGVDNIAFLLGDEPAGPNAQAVSVRATFWIETVRHTVVVGPGHSLTLGPEMQVAGQPAPKFVIDPPIDVTKPRTITFTSKQIQYSQEVFLSFNGLTWPHVSVATLVPLDPIRIPLA